MRTKTIKCLKCGQEDFSLVLRIHERKQNEMQVMCVNCRHILMMKIGDKK